MPGQTVRALKNILLATAALCPASAVQADGDIGELQASYEFLVRDRAEGGVVFKLSAADGGYALPLSFHDTPEYWGSYVCRIPGNTCAVTDTYNTANFEVTPQAGLAGDLQTERVNVHNGANIYDAATWQIAVMLGAVKNQFVVPAGNNAYALASNLNKVLQQSGLDSRASSAPGTKRAVTAGSTFSYNEKTITESKAAYAFRTIAPDWLARDPFMGTRHADLITAKGLPTSNKAYEAGKITWSDWKPITGENAWAFFIGPLQAAHIQHVIGDKKPVIPFDDIAIQNVLDALPAFAAMQSAIGGVYYAPAGTVGNQGTQPLNPHVVSVENNLSLYAGLRLLRATLRAQAAGQLKLTDVDRSKIEKALRTIDVMVDGGSDGAKRKTAGLLSFFRNAAWQDGGFVQGGLANDPAQGRNWVPALTPRAVDVETWAIAALGTKQIDAWFGYGAAFDMWQKLKTWGAYGVGKTLWGVGYSDGDGNGIDASGSYKQGVMSAEWTAGAINAVRNMIGAYSAETPSSSHYAVAVKYIAALKEDETAMLRAVQMLRLDKYQATVFPGKPDNYSDLISEKTKPYLYASRRYFIPFGWYANPIPSTTSTAWMFMLANTYDPFGFGGVPN